jgi:hypothetical protein
MKILMTFFSVLLVSDSILNINFKMLCPAGGFFHLFCTFRVMPFADSDTTGTCYQLNDRVKSKSP